MDTLQSYDWPGNIRELRNVLERAAITNTGTSLYLPDGLSQLKNPNGNNTRLITETELLSLVEVERQHILHTLQKTNWQISGIKGAATILKMNPSTLRSRIKKLGLKKP